MKKHVISAIASVAVGFIGTPAREKAMNVNNADKAAEGKFAEQMPRIKITVEIEMQHN